MREGWIQPTKDSDWVHIGVAEDGTSFRNGRQTEPFDFNAEWNAAYRKAVIMPNGRVVEVNS